LFCSFDVLQENDGSHHEVVVIEQKSCFKSSRDEMVFPELDEANLEDALSCSLHYEFLEMVAVGHIIQLANLASKTWMSMAKSHFSRATSCVAGQKHRPAPHKVYMDTPKRIQSLDELEVFLQVFHRQWKAYNESQVRYLKIALIDPPVPETVFKMMRDNYFTHRRRILSEVPNLVKAIYLLKKKLDSEEKIEHNPQDRPESLA